MGTEQYTASARGVIESAGIEIYHVDGDTIQIAERHRYHLMDSGIRIRVLDATTSEIRYGVRSQATDAPGLANDAHFERILKNYEAEANSRGYAESDRNVNVIKDPTDKTRVLDTWFTIEYRKTLNGENFIEEIKWALAFEKCVD